MEDNDLTPEQIASYNFVEGMTSEADDIDATGAPLWHGWALREAFLAGVRWAKKTGGEETKRSLDQTRAE